MLKVLSSIAVLYEGNINDSDTLEQTMKELVMQTSAINRKPVVVIDVGITEENSLMLKQKGLKEASMNDHFCEHYELELSKKGGTKNYAKVCERIGRLKERCPTANKHYNIEVKLDEKQDKAIDVIWKRTPLKPKSSEGVYFIRTSLFTNR